MAWNIKPSMFADVVTKAAIEHQKNIAVDMFTGVVDLSPVLTSNFVGNTNVSLGSADFSYVEGKTIGRGGALSNGIGVINSIPLGKLQPIYITNGTPYGKYLEGGWSRQAANGVYQVTFMAVSAFYR